MFAEGGEKRVNESLCQGTGLRVYLVPPWAGLPSAEQIKLHLPLAGTSSLMPV